MIIRYYKCKKEGVGGHTAIFSYRTTYCVETFMFSQKQVRIGTALLF